MKKIIIGDYFCSISNLNQREEKILKKELTFLDNSFAMSRGKFDVKKIKKVPFFKIVDKNLCFRTGMLMSVLKTIKKNNIKDFEIEDNRIKLDYQKKEYSYEELRECYSKEYDYVEHQIRALRALLKNKKGIIKATTSAGKSSIILALMKITGLKCLVLVPKDDLGKQLQRDFSEGGIDIYYNSSTVNRKIKPDKSYVSTVGTAHKLPNDFDIVILDECHRGSSDVYQKYLANSKHKAIYGFSATPEGNSKLNFAKIRDFLGEIIEEITPKELLENNVIAFPNIKMIKNYNPGTLSWPDANKLCIVENKERNEIIKEISENTKNTLILIRTIEHGQILNELIEDSIFVSGKDDSKTRQKIIQDFKDEKIDTLIASNIFNEGISINNINSLVIASGGKSKIETVQKLGRILRIDKKTGKFTGDVFDFLDYANKFTQKHGNQRKNIYKKLGFPVKEIQAENIKSQVNN